MSSVFAGGVQGDVGEAVETRDGVDLLVLPGGLRWKKHRNVWRKDLIAVGGVVCILIHLAGGLLLGIFAPDLITLGDIVGNTTDFQRLTSYIPNIGQNPNQYNSTIPLTPH